MSRENYVIGIDIGGTNIRIGLVDEKLNLSAFLKVPQKSVLKGDSLFQLAQFIKGYIKEHAENKTIAALSIGLPAAMDKDRAIVLNAPNIHGFDGKNVKEFLQQEFDFPVFLEKDVSMLFYYDLYNNKIENEGIIIGCYIGTGLGNVISIDGKLVIGNDGAACELGHIPVWDKRDICACGNAGCMETYTAGKFLQQLQQQRYPDVNIEELFEKKSLDPEIESYLEHLSIPIATEINILNPRIVILGGGVLSMKGFPRKKLEQYIYYHARKPLPADNLNIVYSEDSGENGILGSAIYARKKLEYTTV
jgi:allose kinase